jgi:hypothetical protein
MISQTVSRTALWLSLGGWVGSWAFFAFVVSRVAFQVLPGDVAGDLAGMLLGVLNWGGAGLALIAAAAAWALDRRGWLIWLPIALAVLCAGSELFISPAVAAVRPSTLGAAATEETSRLFGLIHALSLGIFLAIHAVSIALFVGHARLDARADEPVHSGSTSK